MYFPSKKEFIRLSKKANVIPVYRELLCDLLTPVLSFKRLKGDYSYLLESIEGEEKIARYSFIGIDPLVIFKSKNNYVELITQDGKTRRFFTDSPLKELQNIMSNFRLAGIEGLPRFCGGFVGFMGYDTVRFFEELPDNNPDKLDVEDCIFIMPHIQVIFDHSTHRIKIMLNVHTGNVSVKELGLISGNKDAGKLYDAALKKIEDIIKRLNAPSKDDGLKRPRRFLPHRVESNFTKDEFTSIVKKAKDYIKSGDIIQVVLSQRFRTELYCDPFDVYRALRSINPSPYMYYLNFDRLKLIGASPEMLVRCENGIVETRPIAGTRPRGSNESEDRKLEKELLMDPKEKAEHVMLVDLGRNDIGRVCSSGTVKVTDFMKIEHYSHVMHIVSNCVGRLAKGKTSYDALKACFPAGTVTGAPKIRAMEIIDELENTKRGPYAGAVGYFSFSGNMDTCINIRSILVKDKEAFIQSGAGIVADSLPDREYKETLNKAKAMLRAIELAENGL